MRKLFLILALLGAASGVQARELVRLTAPVQPVLDGGARAEVAWEAAGALPPDVDEWEAFLSVDGGRHYSVRITPHVDATVRRFTFLVPNVAASDARILIRLGDERHERVIKLNRSFAIVPRLARAELRTPVLTERKGESALFDDDRVGEWVTSDLVVHRHRDLQELETVTCSDAVTSSPFVLSRDGKARATRPRSITIRTIERRKTTTASPTLPASRDPLLLLTRLNI